MSASRSATAAWRPGWRPTPALPITSAVHAIAVVAYVVRPEAAPWIVAALVANHVVLAAAVFMPRGRLLGPNVVRLPAAAAARNEVALTFDDGPDPRVTPQVLDLLDRYGMKATFFCVGRNVNAHAALVGEIVRRGHAVENHTYGHAHWFAALGPRGAARDIDAAQSAIARAAGAAPAFFRAPDGFRSPWLDPLLANRGLTYVSWTRRGFDTVRRDARRVTKALTRGLAAGDVLLLHDGNAGHTRSGEPMVLAVLPAVLEALRARGLRSVALRTALGHA